MRELSDLIDFPWITEKGKALEAFGKYIFRVRPRACKGDIKRFVEQTYHVHVTKVNTMVVPGKKKRVRLQPGFTQEWKKAIVTLKPGEKIDFT